MVAEQNKFISAILKMSKLDAIFGEYEELRSEADMVFKHISHKYSDCVSCDKGCSDCCHALFDLSLVEAMYINKLFSEQFNYGRIRSDILEKASKTDRKLSKIKRDMYRLSKEGQTTDDIIYQVSELKSPCPLLNENNECWIYPYRPIICRLYGVPLDINGSSHVCGLSHFNKGIVYPAVKLSKIQARLAELSAQIANATDSPFDLSDIYVPISMALLTKYDDVYFGKRKENE